MREEKLKSLLTWLGCIFMIIFCLAPFIYMITVSINLRPDFLSLNIPFKLTWQNFRSVLTDPTLHFLRYLVNSLVISRC